MELDDKPAQEIDVQAVPMEHIDTGIRNIPESRNIKPEPDVHRKFSGPAKCSGNVANITDIKTEVIGSDDYHCGNLNSRHGPTYIDHTIGDQIPNTNVTTVTAIKPEPWDETNDDNEFVIEIDTCKDEYYEQYGYPSNGVNINVQESELYGGRTLCAIDLEPCTVGLTGIRNTFPHIILQRSVQIHDPGPTGVIDEHSEVHATNLMMHMEGNTIRKSHTGEKSHTCSVCEISFTKKPNLTCHMRTHTGEKPYICSVCGVGFKKKGNLQKHTRIHTGEKPHKCPVCDVGFTEKRNLTSHIRTHISEKPYKCSVCGGGFTQTGSLKTHMRIHTGEKPYTCSVCGVGFMQKGNMKTHMRIHTGEKPHPCPVCGVSFIHRAHLTQHLRIHTGEKPFKCSVCGVRFTQKGNLKTHMRIHTGEKPHTCLLCDVSFSDKSNLVQHRRLHIGEKANKSLAGYDDVSS